MSTRDDLDNEMAQLMEDEQRKFIEAETKRAKQYRSATLFLIGKLLEDLIRLRGELEQDMSKSGSYFNKQSAVAKDSIEKQISTTIELSEFLKQADLDYYLEQDIKSIVGQIVSYFKQDQNNLHLASLSYHVSDATMFGEGGIDAVVAFLGKHFPEIF